MPRRPVDTASKRTGLGGLVQAELAMNRVTFGLVLMGPRLIGPCLFDP